MPSGRTARRTPRYGGLISFVECADGDIPLIFAASAVEAHAGTRKLGSVACRGLDAAGASFVHVRALRALREHALRREDVGGREPASEDEAMPVLFPEAGCAISRSERDDVVVAWVLDRYGSLSAIGALGELVLVGPGLAEGYMDRPRLTADRFEPCSWAARGTRMFRTGIPARLLEDDELDLLYDDPSDVTRIA